MRDGSTKKILIVDDSALMRRVFCDIIASDKRFEVVDEAANGLEAFDLLCNKEYDAVVLDVNMPRMDGLELLKKLQQYKISARVMMASSDTKEGAKTTMDALELGALDFVHKPDRITECRGKEFQEEFLEVLEAVASSRAAVFQPREGAPKPTVQREVFRTQTEPERTGAVQSVAAQTIPMQTILAQPKSVPGSKIVALTSSTGGPRALQTLIPMLPATLDAPILIVQHMPKGFTASLAERLDELSEIRVKEAEEGETLEKGCVYVARSGLHLNVKALPGGKHVVRYSDEPAREGVKPCANYMFESLGASSYDQVVCVVMTGMGADGTEGIRNLKKTKKTYVIAQDQETCTVYGMPRSAVAASLTDQVVSLSQIAQEIILKVGV